MIKSKIFSHF